MTNLSVFPTNPAAFTVDSIFPGPEPWHRSAASLPTSGLLIIEIVDFVFVEFNRLSDSMDFNQVIVLLITFGSLRLLWHDLNSEAY